MIPQASWLADFMAAEDLPSTFAATALTHWTPLADRIGVLAAEARRPFFVGLCGAQGSGKSTVAAVIAHRLRTQDLQVAVLSIDDVYLPREARLDLARRVHPLLTTRGPPGTHDLELAGAVFDGLSRAGPVALPSFDKASDTRKPQAQWETFQGPADVVIFEGWCVGAWPEATEALITPINDLEARHDPDGRWRTFVNTTLAGPYQDLFARLDRLVLLQAPGFETVLAWRREQERKLRDRLARSGQDLARAMTDAQVATFIAHYERLTRHILREMPARADETLRLDAIRTPINP